MSIVQSLVIPKGNQPESVLVEAVAKASATSLSNRADEPCYRNWMSGTFTKSVRLARTNASFDRITSEADDVYDFNGITIAVFSPMSYEEFPIVLRKTSVQGIKRVNDLKKLSYLDREAVVLHDVEMTSGKKAAQAAHAMCLSDNLEIPVRVFDDSIRLEYRKDIVDSGLTEFEGVKTLTASLVKVIHEL